MEYNDKELTDATASMGEGIPSEENNPKANERTPLGVSLKKEVLSDADAGTSADSGEPEAVSHYMRSDNIPANLTPEEIAAEFAAFSDQKLAASGLESDFTGTFEAISNDGLVSPQADNAVDSGAGDSANATHSSDESAQETADQGDAASSSSQAYVDAQKKFWEKLAAENAQKKEADEAAAQQSFEDSSKPQLEKKRKFKTGSEPGSKKKWIILGSIVGALVLIYLAGVLFFNSHFLSGTVANDIDMSFCNIDKATELLQSNVTDYSISLVALDNTNDTIVAKDIDLKFADAEGIKKALENQNNWSWPISFFKKSETAYAEVYTFDESKLAAKIADLDCVKNSGSIATENAHPVYANGAVTIQDEVQGNTLDTESFNNTLRTAIKQGRTELNLLNDNCYLKPKFKADASEVAQAKTTLEKYIKGTVTYTFGDDKEQVTSDMIAQWTNYGYEDMAVSIDQDDVAEYVATLAGEYNTAGGSHNFTTSGGSSIVVSGGSYGWTIDQAQETEDLIANIEAGTPVTKEPAYAVKGASRDNNDIGNTYVEVSISAQTMWLYVDGSLIVSTPVVTGCVNNGTPTYTGVYYIAYKTTNATLKGDGYESFVNYWMPFDLGNGIGIHDADGWRSSYGGSIYISGGSHGCVNTPLSATATIYNNAPTGTPVVVY